MAFFVAAAAGLGILVLAAPWADSTRDVGRRPDAKSLLTSTIGNGAQSVQVFIGRGPARPTVIFMHGWGLTGAGAYRGWIRHLTDRGSTVIVPRYQNSLRTPTEQVPANAMAGIRRGLASLPSSPRDVVVMGHSAGGILAVDYAVQAVSDPALPDASAAMIVFPGGAIRDMPEVPEEDPAQIPSTVGRLVVMASPTDTVVGTAPAKAVSDGATAVPRRRLVLVNDPVAGNHFAPALDGPASRRAFWRVLDNLLVTDRP